MLGYLCAPTGAHELPGIVLVHDAFGLNDDTIQTAERYAALGFAVFAADVWGDRTTATAESQIGPLIGGMVSDHARWMGRIEAAHLTLAAQPEVDAEAIITAGYCFGASSALEYLRTGGNTRGVVSIHAGLDLLRPNWAAATTPARVLVCTGADDPMATAQMRSELQVALSGAAIDWELNLYSDTKHAYTNPKSAFSPMPDVVAYNPQSAARSWESTKRFLGELFPDARPAA
ncbi:dienelactone hydrolase family protein [Leifsonia kafniensis]|uniref:Dienelactone hydrolase family protein n=2 Tax=Leifsonia kafniensis TaxID=475957 RepID=A0ABP7KL62_9MICO